MSIIRNLKKFDEYVAQRFHKISLLFEVMNDFGFDCQLPVIYELLKKNNIKVGITTSGLWDVTLARQYITDQEFGQYYIEPSKAVWKKWSMVSAQS